MADGPLDNVLKHIRKLAGAPELEGMADRQLLERFARQRDAGDWGRME